jgi:hypothetical protein
MKDLYVGDVKTFDVAVTVDGAAANISGWTFKFAAATSLDKNFPGVTFSVDNTGFTITDAPTGRVRGVIPASKTLALSLKKDTSFHFSVVGIETNGAPHTLVTGALPVRLAADDMLS